MTARQLDSRSSVSLGKNLAQLCVAVCEVVNLTVVYSGAPALGRCSSGASYSLFQALCQWGRLKERAGDERGLVGKHERLGEPVSIVLKTSLLCSGIPAPGKPSDWLLLTVYINTLSVCRKRGDA